MSEIIAADVEALLDRTTPLWPELCGARLFVTGGTGFFGTWLLEALVAANRRFALGCHVTVLSRDPGRFTAKAPQLTTDRAVTLLAGDVRDFHFPAGSVTHVIHAATEASAALNESHPRTMFDVCVEGTRRVLSLARERGATRLLFTSSGAVYGRQPPDLARMPEDHPGGPDPLDAKNAYAEGKRAAEMLCRLAVDTGVAATIARCFAFVGPRLPLDAHFAAGNFIRDALAGGPIRVAGDGTPYRSYLYAADLVEWLLTILLRGAPARAYNVGSEEAVSIRDLAEMVADVAAAEWPGRERPRVTVAGRPPAGTAATRYVPSCARARTELGLVPATSLEEALRRTLVAAAEERMP